MSTNKIPYKCLFSASLWHRCAREEGAWFINTFNGFDHNTNCECNGFVRYGMNNWTPWKMIRGNINCNSENFGYDPDDGIVILSVKRPEILLVLLREKRANVVFMVSITSNLQITQQTFRKMQLQFRKICLKSMPF